MQRYLNAREQNFFNDAFHKNDYLTTEDKDMQNDQPIVVNIGTPDSPVTMTYNICTAIFVAQQILDIISQQLNCPVLFRDKKIKKERECFAMGEKPRRTKIKNSDKEVKIIKKRGRPPKKIQIDLDETE